MDLPVIQLVKLKSLNDNGLSSVKKTRAGGPTSRFEALMMKEKVARPPDKPPPAPPVKPLPPPRAASPPFRLPLDVYKLYKDEPVEPGELEERRREEEERLAASDKREREEREELLAKIQARKEAPPPPKPLKEVEYYKPDEDYPEVKLSDEEMLGVIKQYHAAAEERVKKEIASGRKAYGHYDYADALQEIYKKQLLGGMPRERFVLTLNAYNNMRHKRTMGKFITFEDSVKAEMKK